MRKSFDSKHFGPLLLFLWSFACLSISIALYLPGLDDLDTDQLIRDGQSGFYNNWHSVLLAFCLHTGAAHLPQFSPYDLIFLVTMGSYWMAIATIASLSIRGLLKQCGFVVMAGFYLPSFALMLSDNKDSLMCGSLLLAYASLLKASYVSHRIAKFALILVAGTVLLVVAAERHNGFIAAAPFCAWLLSLLFQAPSSKSAASLIKYGILGTVLSISFALFDRFISEEFLMSAEEYPLQMLMIWDLTNLSVKSGETLFPKLDLGPKLTLDKLKTYYCEYSCDQVFWGHTLPDHPRFLRLPDEYNVLVKAWLAAIAKHPLLYLEHRALAFFSLLGIIHGNQQIRPYFYLMIDHQTDHTEPSPFLSSAFNQTIRKYVPQAHLLHFPPILTSGGPALFLLVLYAICSLLKRLIPSRGEPYLVISALLYVGAFFFISIGNNQRYMTYPISVSALLIARLLLDSRYTFPSKRNVVK